VIAPGATIGIIGGGQLGRMIAIAAAQLGYRCHVFAPDAGPPASDVAAEVTQAGYDDLDALQRFAAAVDVATYEFENLPAASLGQIAAKLRPGTASLAIAQDRTAEKSFLEANGLPVSAWQPIDSLDALRAAVDQCSGAAVLKTRRLGYDGKGQAWIRSAADVEPAWDAIAGEPAVLEQAVAFDAEFSVVIARSAAGEVRAFPVPENAHEGGILRRSTVPAGPTVEPHVPRALEIAERIIAALRHVGVLTVEFFATPNGPLVNEIAPRVHNSGHWTIEGAATSQFEQHVRAICGLPLGATDLRGQRIAMDNLIGDDVLAWERLVAEPGAGLHLYGKGAPRPGRKMGHVTRVTL
jgi:5-(carboxyamino)imidazole ribonucleotide synthase